MKYSLSTKLFGVLALSALALGSAQAASDDKADAALSAALAQMRAFRDAPPSDMPQPIRLRITNRMTG